MVDSAIFIHPTAIIEQGVDIGKNTAVWDGVHIRKGASIGHDCIIGEKAHIAYNVKIGNYVKIGSMVHIPVAVTIEDFVMISVGTVFANEKLPRAFRPDLKGLASSEPTQETLSTVVRRGATIGINATIGCGIEIGKFSMIGMGAVVTKSIPPYALVYGNPAVHRGYVCMCGCILMSFKESEKKVASRHKMTCSRCMRVFELSEDLIIHKLG